MRTLLTSVVVALLVVTGVGAQTSSPWATSPYRPPQDIIQEQSLQLGWKLSERAREWQEPLSGLGLEVHREIRRWDMAVQAWKKEPGAGAAPLLAEGVLLDCLTRWQSMDTTTLAIEQGPAPFDYLAAKRPARAAQAFDAALKLDPSLSEARMRAARIRAAKDPDAMLELERIADGRAGSVLSYVSALSRAQVALEQHDVAGALHWYERSVSLMSVRSDLPDQYSTYPCTVLTPAVETALTERIQKVAPK